MNEPLKCPVMRGGNTSRAKSMEWWPESLSLEDLFLGIYSS